MSGKHQRHLLSNIFMNEETNCFAAQQAEKLVNRKRYSSQLIATLFYECFIISALARAANILLFSLPILYLKTQR
jgi:hypothetical protein